MFLQVSLKSNRISDLIHFFNIVSEESPEEGDSLQEVAIIKQKRKFDAIHDEGTATEENVSKKIKFEEWVDPASRHSKPRAILYKLLYLLYILYLDYK